MNIQPNSNPESESESLDLLGRTIGDYLVLRRLGSGGMAHVYLAEQLSLKRKVALKILKPELGLDQGYVQRFVREAQAAAALVQSNIVQIYEVGQAEGYHFIAQEYIPGRNLKQFISRHGGVDAVMVLNVLRQAALALQKAGEQGVVHRDIKPENIMLSTSGEVKITDFGLARITNETQRMDLTQIGITMGTPLYMSPEQVEGRPVDVRTDIYSLGITAYHMLAGHPPFDGDNALAVALKHVNNQPEDLVSLRPDVPQELIWIIEKMMAKKPEDRPQNATQLLKSLRTVKIDQEGDWESLAEKLATVDSRSQGRLPMSLTSKLAVTRQLQQVIQSHANVPWRQPRWLAAALALAILGSLVGVAWAWYSPVADPLALIASSQSSVPKKESAEAQYRAAQWVGFPEFYEAVLDYFPAEKAPVEQRNSTLLFNRLAIQRLAEYHLQRLEVDSAFARFQQLASVDETATEFRAAGYAGLAIIHDYYGNELDARVYFLQAYQHYSLLNEYLKSRLDELIEQFGAEDPRGPRTQISPLKGIGQSLPRRTPRT